MYSFLLDVRLALRRLRNSPGFTLVAVFTLALGIGANAVVFSAVNSLLLHGLPIAKASRVFFVEESRKLNSSYPDYQDLRDRNNTFSGLFAYRINVAGLQTSDARNAQAERVWLYEATGNYFPTLGIKPYLGRFFSAEEDKVQDANPVAVISYASWSSRFNSDRNIVGKTIALNKYLFTIVGVAPPGFQGTELLFAPELWVPMSMEKEIENYSHRDLRQAHVVWVAGRLRDGATPEHAAANLNTISSQLASAYPNTDTGLHYELSPPGFLGNAIGRPMRAFLLGLSVLAGLVLLAACTNLGSLLAARVADRYKELGIRIAIGARRITILRQLLTEAALLALAGAAVGLGLNIVLVRVIGRITLPMDMPIQLVISSDGWVLVFAVMVALLTTLVFSIAPARQIWRTDPNTALKSTQPMASVSGRRWAFRDIVLGLQVAICCVLVTACFTSLRGLQRALHTSFGFDPNHVVLAGFDPEQDSHDKDESAKIQRSIAERASHLPGVVSASFANAVPLSLDRSTVTVFDQRATDLNLSKGIRATDYSIAPAYFLSAGTRLLSGRDVRWQDDSHAPQVAIVNATFATKVFGTLDAVGKHFRNGASPALTEVIGVVEDGKYLTITEDPEPAVFFPITQERASETMLVVRTFHFDPNLASEIRRVIHEQDPAMPVYSLGPWDDLLEYALFPARAATVALTAFGVLGLLLAVTGIYGLAAYTVARRMRELGVRVALGAQQRQVLRAALGRALLLLVAGSVGGVGLGVAAGKILARVVYQASASDPVVLIAVAVTMIGVGLVSTAVPARRALTIDAVRLLRQD